MNFKEDTPPVKLKGVGDSLWVTINPSLPIDQLKQGLITPFQRLKHLAVNARIIIDTGAEDLENRDELIETLGDFLKKEFQVGTSPSPSLPTVQ